MTATITPASTTQRVRHPRNAPGSTFVKWATTTDHKKIGNLYFITSFTVSYTHLDVYKRQPPTCL